MIGVVLLASATIGLLASAAVVLLTSIVDVL